MQPQIEPHLELAFELGGSYVRAQRNVVNVEGKEPPHRPCRNKVVQKEMKTPADVVAIERKGVDRISTPAGPERACGKLSRYNDLLDAQRFDVDLPEGSR